MYKCIKVLISWSFRPPSIHVIPNPFVSLLVDKSKEGRLGVPTNTRARADHSPLLPHTPIPCNKRSSTVPLTHCRTLLCPCSTQLARKNFYSPFVAAVMPSDNVYLKSGETYHCKNNSLRVGDENCWEAQIQQSSF